MNFIHLHPGGGGCSHPGGLPARGGLLPPESPLDVVGRRGGEDAEDGVVVGQGPHHVRTTARPTEPEMVYGTVNVANLQSQTDVLPKYLGSAEILFAYLSII
jgi:hypothetical protein